VSPAFVATLCLLLVNDLLLKPLFHNWLTGKLSDFAGLFIFPLFFFVLCPRYKKAIYVLTALSFCYWKTSYAQPLIDAWNVLSIVSVSRVVDSSDMIALLALPFSYRYSGVEQRSPSRHFAVLPVALLSVFAFAATSYSTEVEYSNDYQFEGSKLELTRKVYHLADLNGRDTGISCNSNRPGEIALKIEIPSDFCFGSVTASIVIGETEGKGTITLKKMRHRCPKGKEDQQRLAAVFERECIDKIRDLNLDPDYTTVGKAESSDRSRSSPAGPLYLVAIGGTPEINIEALTRELEAKYRLSAKMLPPIPLTDDVREPGFPNSRPVAERLVEAMKQRHPEIARDPTAIMIGFTKDMHVSESHRMYEFSYQSQGRFAVVAIESLNPSTFCEPANANLLGSRLQKVLARNIGTLCYRLGPNDDPRSVLYRSTICVHDLDKMRTGLWPIEGDISGNGR